MELGRWHIPNSTGARTSIIRTLVSDFSDASRSYSPSDQEVVTQLIIVN